MSTHAEINWQTLRDLCDEAGIGREFRDYEDSLPNVVLQAIVGSTHTEQRYLTDAEFHANVDTLVLTIVAVLIAKPAVRHSLADMEALNKIFLDEAEAFRK